jgi:hypothetical protein
LFTSTSIEPKRCTAAAAVLTACSAFVTSCSSVKQWTALATQAGLEVGMLAAGGNDVVACAQCRLGDLDAESASRARDEPGSCHDGLLRTVIVERCDGACISAITLRIAGPVISHLTVHTVNRLPALLHLADCEKSFAQGGPEQIDLELAVTTSWSSGALVNAA